MKTYVHIIENVRFDLFLCEVQVENTANIGRGPINFSVKRPEVDWSRTNIGTNIVTNIGTKLQIGMTGTTLSFGKEEHDQRAIDVIH